jgi:DNA-directed RNA polymerase subunit RPC12/RpoP
MKKKIKCPCCGSRLMDSNEKIKTLVLETQSSDEDAADYFIKCKGCKKEIGIIKIK